LGGIRWAVYVAVYVFPRMCNEREWRSNPRKESENRRAGRRVVRTKPANTSKRCARCGYVVEKGLFVCPKCGWEADRDYNA